jgi:YHS domain-containing protein
MKKIIGIIYLSVFTLGIANAQSSARAKEFNLEKGVAIQGYDPVAYFSQDKAVKGNQQFAAVADGVTYHFSSAANKDLFVRDYKKYEPQYGGWCAYAMGAANEKVEIDPETFKILNGKLYLFYHSWVNNTLNKWNKDEANLKTKADKNWMAIFH